MSQLIGTNANFSQNDPRWQAAFLGFSGWETLGRFGCAMAAGANILQAQGLGVTPSEVNDLLKARGQFVRDSYNQIADFAGYQAFGVISPHTHFVESKVWDKATVAPIDYFDVRMSTDIELMVEIDYHPDITGVQTHFCRVIGINAAKNDIEIVDSWDGKRKWLSSIAAQGGKKALQIIWSAGKFQKV